jgi:hypothetical protein
MIAGTPTPRPEVADAGKDPARRGHVRARPQGGARRHRAGPCRRRDRRRSRADGTVAQETCACLGPGRSALGLGVPDGEDEPRGSRKGACDEAARSRPRRPSLDGDAGRRRAPGAGRRGAVQPGRWPLRHPRVPRGGRRRLDAPSPGRRRLPRGGRRPDAAARPGLDGAGGAVPRRPRPPRAGPARRGAAADLEDRRRRHPAQPAVRLPGPSRGGRPAGRGTARCPVRRPGAAGSRERGRLRGGPPRRHRLGPHSVRRRGWHHRRRLPAHPRRPVPGGAPGRLPGRPGQRPGPCGGRGAVAYGGGGRVRPAAGRAPRRLGGQVGRRRGRHRRRPGRRARRPVRPVPPVGVRRRRARGGRGGAG